MSPRLSSIIGWTATILIAAFNLFAAVMKFLPVAPGSPAEEMGKVLGTAGLERGLGVLELIIIALFLIPRTSTVGFVLMVGYMGGALATNMTHGFTSTAELMPLFVLFVLLTVSGYFRNPELVTRLKGRPLSF